MGKEGREGYEGTSRFVPDSNIQFHEESYGLGAVELGIG
jgi:hypothetical protein